MIKQEDFNDTLNLMLLLLIKYKGFFRTGLCAFYGVLHEQGLISYKRLIKIWQVMDIIRPATGSDLYWFNSGQYNVRKKFLSDKLIEVTQKESYVNILVESRDFSSNTIIWLYINETRYVNIAEFQTKSDGLEYAKDIAIFLKCNIKEIES